MELSKDVLKEQIQTGRAALSDALNHLLKRIASQSTHYGLVVLGGVAVLVLLNALLVRVKYRTLKTKILRKQGDQDIVVVQPRDIGIVSLIKWHVASYLLGLAKKELEKLLERLRPKSN